ncbi:hypothetical protein F5882DRAFT_470158 [Hyaloscypha sp. PMI_1271]|nr:hypothetical protein F5882DRAFT_470158 [Hyaloscypha sp. PMI_1271]
MDVLDLDAFSSCPASILDDISLSGVLPIDTAIFGEGPNWTTDRTDNQNQCWPRQIGLSNPYSQVLSPLEGLFPRTNQTWIGSPAGTNTSQEGGEQYANESSTLASIVCSNLHDITSNPHQSSIRTLLQEVAIKALDATIFPNASNEDSSAPTLHHPHYERHIVQEYANAYFDEFHQRFPFILRDQFQCLMDALLTRKLPGGSPAVPLINAILSLGCRLVQKRKTNDPRVADREARRYHAVALGAREHLTIYFQSLQTSALALSLVSTAVQHCLTLKLNRIKSVRTLASSDQEYQLLRHVFWVVYSLEKPLAMRLGRCSSIDDDFVDFSPRMIQNSSEPGTTNQPGLFIHLCEHAKLCSMVVKQLYGITKSRARRNDIQETFHSLDMLLQDWRDSRLEQRGLIQTDPGLPVPERTIQSSYDENNVELYLRYHELKVTIYHKGKPCVQSAREVLSQAHLWEPSAKYSDWLIVQVPIMACCVLLIDVFSNDRSEDFRSNMAFLGMASGWLGRLAITTSHSIAFNEIMELISLAQQQCKI